jgi:hypothetical protein
MTEGRARIRWLTKEEGGRESPPSGPHYSTVARFEVLRDRWPKEAWSVVLRIEGPDRTQVGIRPLVHDAPADLFASGSCFDLFEGAQKVAEGKVL